MSSQSSGERTAKKYTGQAVNTLTSARTDMLSNPLFLLGQQLATQVGQNPLSLSPDTVRGIKNNAIESEYDTYRGALGSGLERAGAAGAYRDGSTRMMERDLATDLSSSIGNINRGVDIQAAMQRNQDLANAATVTSGAVGQRYAFDRDIANVLGGAATNPAFSQPSPKSNALGGLGGIGGAVLGSGFSPGWLGIGGQ